MSAEEEDRLDFGEDDDDRESEISLGFGGDEVAENGGAEKEDSSMQGVEAAPRKYDASNGQERVATDEAPQGSGPPLPAGWDRRVSRKGETYYLNTVTNQSTWDEPTEPAVAGISDSEKPSRQSSEKPTSGQKEASTNAAENNASTASKLIESVSSTKEALLKKGGSALSLASTILRSDREDGETDSEKDPNSPAVVSIARSEPLKTGEIPTGPARKRGPLPPQNQAFSRKATLASLSQPPIGKPPQGPSADARKVAALASESRQSSAAPTTKHSTSSESKAAVSAGTKTAQGESSRSTSPIVPVQSQAQTSRTAPEAPVKASTIVPTGPSASLPTGPKADRQPPTGPRASRPGSVQISRSLSGGNGPPTAPPALAGVPTGPAASRFPPRNAPQGPSTAPLPHQSSSSRSGMTHRSQPSVDNGWGNRRKVSTAEVTTGPAPSPEPAPKTAIKDSDLPDGPRRSAEVLPPPREPRSLRKVAAPPPPGLSRDNGWGSRAIAPPAKMEREDKDTRMRSRTPPPRPASPKGRTAPSKESERPVSPPPYRQKKPLPPQSDVARGGGRPARRDARSLTPPPPRRRSRTPSPRRRNDTPPPRRRNDTPPPRRREESPPPRRRGDSPPPRRAQDAIDRYDRADSRPRQVSPPRDLRRRLPSPIPARRRSPSPIAGRRRSPSPAALRRRRSPSMPEKRPEAAPSLMSRLGPRRDESPPAKRSRNDAYDARDGGRRRSSDRMEVDEEEDRRRPVERRSRFKTRSPSPPLGANGLSILGSSRNRANQLASALDTPDDDEAPIVDITAGLKIEEEKVGRKGSSLIRLWNPNKGTSVDARAFIAAVQHNEETSPQASGLARARSISHNSPFAAGIAGLPPKPISSDDTFRNARNISSSDDVLPPPPSSTVIIDSYRPSLGARKDSRNVANAYRSESRRDRSRSPPPYRRGAARSRSLSRERERDPRRERPRERRR